MSPTANLRRYVLLRHECPADYRDGPHWDLMIEDGDALRTWSLLELPAEWQSVLKTLPDPRGSAELNSTKSIRAATVRERPNRVPATELPPHRLAYLDREGEVSDDRGYVKRIARGECQLTTEEPTLLIINATAGELHGEWRIDKTRQAWRLTVTIH